jgi:chaperonin GroES
MSALRKLIPLADRVLVKRIAAVEKSIGGIILPESAIKRPNEGEILAVGPGSLLDNGDRSDMPVSVGDTVLLPEYGGTAVKMPDATDDEVFLFRADDILGKYE